MTNPFTAAGTRRCIFTLIFGGLLVLAYAVWHLFMCRDGEMLLAQFCQDSAAFRRGPH